MEFREVLGQLRRERGMNQEQLAEQIGVSRQAVSKWETGEASPDLPNLLALADALDVSLEVLCARAAGDAAPPPPVAEAPAPKKKRRWIGALIAAIVIGMLLPILLALVNYARIETATDEDSAYIALDTKTYLSLAESMSTPEFTLMDGDPRLIFRLFCAAEHAGDFHYSFQLLDEAGNVYAGVAEYQDGMVSGSVSLLNRTAARFTACLHVRDERDGSLLIPLASNVTLDFSTNSVTWTPVLAQ